MSDGPSSVQSQERDLQEIDQLAQLTLEYLDVLNGSQDVLPQLDGLSSDLRTQVLAAWSNVDQLVVNEPLPPLDADPTAIALGAVPTTLLDPAVLRRARQHRKLRPSDVAASLRALGWSTSTSEVFAWERRTEHIAPALLADIAAILNVSTNSLTGAESAVTAAGVDAAETDDATQTFLRVLYSDDINEVVQQWAHLLGLDSGAARQDLQRRLSSAAHRGQRILTLRQWKAVLRVLLASERARRGLPNDPLPDA